MVFPLCTQLCSEPMHKCRIVSMQAGKFVAFSPVGYRAITSLSSDHAGGSLRSVSMLRGLQPRHVSVTVQNLSSRSFPTVKPSRALTQARCMSSVKATQNAVQKPSELVTLVDKDNNIVGEATRGEMRAQNAIHRCSFVAIFNSQGSMYVQKRVSFKETYPSHYDPAPGGVVGANETYEENASREIEEEMGISGVTLEKSFDFFHDDEFTKLWGRLFTCTYDGKFTLDPEEVESGKFMTVQEVKHMLDTEPVTPDSKACIEQYLAQL